MQIMLFQVLNRMERETLNLKMESYLLRLKNIEMVIQ